MSFVINQLHVDLCGDLERIARRFKNPKITLIVRVRAPDQGDGDVVLTDDSLDEAIAAIRRLQAQANGGIFPARRAALSNIPDPARQDPPNTKGDIS